MSKNVRAAINMLGVVCLIVGFALLKPALGFLAAGTLALLPNFLNRK